MSDRHPDGTPDVLASDDGHDDDAPDDTETQPPAERTGPPPKPLGSGTDPLVIRSLEFMGGMAERGGWRPDLTLPEVAFVGRSNVGKSSLLNKLVRRKAFARVSRTPGRTREINFFRVNDRFVLVDLPGYGYARVAKSRQAEWRPLMDAYLRYTQQLRGLVLLLDARREPSPDDLEMLDYLAELEVPVLFAVTKVDKLGRSEVGPRIESIARDLAVEADHLVPFSATTGQGRDELAAAVAELVETDAWRHA